MKATSLLFVYIFSVIFLYSCSNDIAATDDTTKILFLNEFKSNMFGWAKVNYYDLVLGAGEFRYTVEGQPAKQFWWPFVHKTTGQKVWVGALYMLEGDNQVVAFEFHNSKSTNNKVYDNQHLWSFIEHSGFLISKEEFANLLDQMPDIKLEDNSGFFVTRTNQFGLYTVSSGIGKNPATRQEVDGSFAWLLDTSISTKPIDLPDQPLKLVAVDHANLN
jgi:hypothetical protein